MLTKEELLHMRNMSFDDIEPEDIPDIKDLDIDAFITIRMKSFINNIYPADTSRSVRANLLAKKLDGQCVAAFAFYGYLKSPENKHKLVAGPVAGVVVQDIFHL